ncbi:MAG: DUF427 domain-containing protein [Kineosporiaceae bacterium]
MHPPPQRPDRGAGRLLPRGVVPVDPGPGQESVWDYPRPPLVEPTGEHVVVVLGGAVVLDTRRALRMLETSHPPTYYLPLADAAPGAFRPTAGTSWCEFKGTAAYLDVVGGPGGERRDGGTAVGDQVVAGAAAWTYPSPSPGYAVLRGHVALYPDRMDRCTVDGEVVRGQDGGFYGGWVTSRVVGPFKGGPGSRGW